MLPDHKVSSVLEGDVSLDESRPVGDLSGEPFACISKLTASRVR